MRGQLHHTHPSCLDRWIRRRTSCRRRDVRGQAAPCRPTRLDRGRDAENARVAPVSRDTHNGSLCFCSLVDLPRVTFTDFLAVRSKKKQRYKRGTEVNKQQTRRKGTSQKISPLKGVENRKTSQIFSNLGRP